MKNVTLALQLCGALVLVSATAVFGETPADFVNPIIGSDEFGHVFPGAAVPFGMVQLSPDTKDGTWQGCSGYHYSDNSILGFSHNHLTGTGCGDLGNVLFMPTTGELKLTPGKAPGEGYRARFSHDQEISRPGYYQVFLPDYKVAVELTATARAGMHRYTFQEAGDGHVILDLWHGIDNAPTDAAIKVENDQTISGYRKSAGWGGDKVFYFVAEFSRPFTAEGICLDKKDISAKEAQGKVIKAHFEFKNRAGEQVLIRVALSTVSVEGARRNLHAEMPNWNFEAFAIAARARWNQALDTAKIETKDVNLKKTYYTALYRVHLAPTLLSDVDGQFRGPDGQVHQTKGNNYYTELSLWDTFRAEHPLLTIIEPHRVDDMVNTMLTHYTIFGQKTLPVWPEGGKETWCMIGNHAIPVIADAYAKGFHKFDANEALADMLATTQGDREQLDAYRRQGWIPTSPNHNASDRWQSVSKTLEYAYDDACVARMARSLGCEDVATTYARRSTNWLNVFDPSTGFMRGRNALDGSWVTPFDPNRVDFNDYTEANAWQYTFFVPHNVPGMIQAMGGDDKFVAKLDELFDTKAQIPNPWLDITGLIGMYAHGNEPCHHVAFLYNYAGQPWKTQARTRQVACTLYKNAPNGLCGNDDCGQMSAWYVFTALGFYPVDPASGVYVIGSPLVDKASIKLDRRHYSGHTFTVTAKNNSPANVYIQSATLNGHPLSRSWITHKEIVAGGKLALTMGNTPNRAWGSAPQDRPAQALVP